MEKEITCSCGHPVSLKDNENVCGYCGRCFDKNGNMRQEIHFDELWTCCEYAL